jgi:catechol 2,3-dioxygenase-like lactoylglutathione lyase family enzyme
VRATQIAEAHRPKEVRMKRFHVHLSVADLQASIGFYSRLFGVAPTVEKADYAKWMLDDPRVNFAISTWNGAHGLNHLGMQAESDEELATIGAHFAEADAATTIAEPDAHCCYAVSDKHWVRDPQGVAWEAFHTLDSIPTYGERAPAKATPSGCCAPVSTAPGDGCGCSAARA